VAGSPGTGGRNDPEKTKMYSQIEDIVLLISINSKLTCAVLFAENI
jgi:hypothetical protein